MDGTCLVSGGGFFDTGGGSVCVYADDTVEETDDEPNAMQVGLPVPAADR
jgi:hypothetical protein